MRNWATSDPHFFHTNVIRYCGRPWATAEEMNEGLIANWNSVVGHDDLVWLLGDFCFGGPTKAEAILERLKGRIALVMGNHDWKTKETRWRKMGLEMVLPHAELQLKDGKKLKLSHFPYRGDHTAQDRYVEHRLQDDGESWLLHGHVHTAWKVRGRQINVGVDAWDYRPVAFETLFDLIAKGAHHENTDRRGLEGTEGIVDDRY